MGDDFTGQIMPDMAYTAKTSDDAEATSFLHAVASYWKAKSASIEPQPDGFVIRPYKNDYQLFASYYPETRRLELAGVLQSCIWRYGTPQPDDNP